MDPSEQPVMSAAQRRKQRRLRSWWRHEQQSIAAALATTLHHSSRGQRKARAGEEESETKYTAKFRTTPPPQPVLFSLYDEEPGGGRPEALVEPRPQARVQRHTVEHITDLVRVAPMVQILDATVPQTGDQLPDILSFFGAFMPDPEQVIEVPKILLDDVPMRAVDREPQLGEQLVEVPTDPGYALAVVAKMVLFEARDSSDDRRASGRGCLGRSSWFSFWTGFNSVWVSSRRQSSSSGSAGRRWRCPRFSPCSSGS